ncbi:WD40 repeat-like protein [Hesseltinella vesiculosa]|uniref:WD40 repeat-like protein n=1 Tax=Hesseltinella vesiculosa TaxID=101127 RepID=A0A1X2G2J5_9FUNG|nr:WD40 repeat-like protein [Hesseltinella vesiculosa]
MNVIVISSDEDDDNDVEMFDAAPPRLSKPNTAEWESSERDLFEVKPTMDNAGDVATGNGNDMADDKKTLSTYSLDMKHSLIARTTRNNDNSANGQPLDFQSTILSLIHDGNVPDTLFTDDDLPMEYTMSTAQPQEQNPSTPWCLPSEELFDPLEQGNYHKALVRLNVYHVSTYQYINELMLNSYPRCVPMMPTQVISLFDADHHSSTALTHANNHPGLYGKKRKLIKDIIHGAFMVELPYIPALVWQDSNWEDWSQFEDFRVIHIPFTTWEDEHIVDEADQLLSRKKLSYAAILDDINVWGVIALYLPGRSPKDCRLRYFDLTEKFDTRPFMRPAMVCRKPRPKHKTPRKGLYNWTRHRSQESRGSIIRNYQSAIWTNFSHQTIIAEGSGDALCVAISSTRNKTNGFQVVSGSLCQEEISYNFEGNLRVWDSDTKDTHHLRGHYSEFTLTDGTQQVLWHTVEDVKVSNHDRLLYSAGRDGNCRIWDLITKELRAVLSFHTKPVHQISISALHPRLIATCSDDGLAAIWQINRDGLGGRGLTCESLHPGTLSSSADCISFGNGPSSYSLFAGYRASSTSNGWIQMFDVKTGFANYIIDDIGGSIGCLAISHSGKFILSGNDNSESDNGRPRTGDQLLHMHDTRNGQSVLRARTGHVDVNCVTFSECDTYIASGSEANQISIFDIRKAKHPLYEFAHNGIPIDAGFESGMGIAQMHWMKNNTMLITGGSDCSVKVWDVSGGNGLLKTYETPDAVDCVAVDEDHHVIAAGVNGAQGIVCVWQP